MYAVRSPSRLSVRTSAPLATPRRVLGTVIRNVKSALSSGWSLHGKTVCAELGCGHTANPSGVGTQAVWARARRGSAPYATQIVVQVCAGSAQSGVIRSFSSTCSYVAVRPATRTERMSRPRASRERRLRAWVVRTRRVASPSTSWVVAS